MKYKVTRTVVETILVEGRNAANALDNALDYENQNNWLSEGESHLVEQAWQA